MMEGGPLGLAARIAMSYKDRKGGSHELARRRKSSDPVDVGGGGEGQDWRTNPGKRPFGYPGKTPYKDGFTSMDATSEGQYASHMFLGDHYIDDNGNHYYGKAAQYAYHNDHGGPPTDGITGEPGYFGTWAPNEGSGDQDYSDYDDEGGDYGSGEARWGEFDGGDDRWGAR